jgi:prepilin-type N-terminal cleavage/methylation domain-containing protein
MTGKGKNKGFTLLELIVSIAIMTLVMGSIAYFMTYSSRNYRNANEKINLQMESQTILNQLNDLIIEAYNVKFTGNVLTIYQKDARYIIALQTDKNELTFEKVLTGQTSIGDSQVFGEYIVNFSVTDTGSDNSNNVIKISFDLKQNQNTYAVHDSIIKLRNQIKSVSP